MVMTVCMAMELMTAEVLAPGLKNNFFAFERGALADPHPRAGGSHRRATSPNLRPLTH